MKIQSRMGFYRDMEKSRETSKLFLPPWKKKVQELTSMVEKARKHTHSVIKSLRIAKKYIKQFENEIKHLKYDKNNLTEELLKLGRELAVFRKKSDQKAFGKKAIGNSPYA